MRVITLLLLLLGQAASFRLFKDNPLKTKFAIGRWDLIYASDARFPQRQVVVNIFPSQRLIAKHSYMKGPMLFNQVYEGRYELEKDKINIIFAKPHVKLLSIFGIYFDQPIHISNNILPYHCSMKVTHITSNEIFLESFSSEKFCYLVRAKSIDEENVNIYMSTFVVTQTISLFISYMISHALILLNDLKTHK